MNEYEVIRIDEDTWRIENNGVRFFLLEGRKEALLIDSGMTLKDVRRIARGLTQKPLKLINTHADPDHIGGNDQFEVFLMHPSEASNFYKTQNRRGTFLPVYDGDIIDIGGRPIEVILLPGHTPGHIALLDRNKGVLFGGDAIQNGRIFMFGVQREINAYIKSLRRLDNYKGLYDIVYPSHGSFPVSPSLINKLADAAEKVMKKQFEGKPVEFFGMKAVLYHTPVADFLMED